MHVRHIESSDWDSIVALEADTYDELSEARDALQSRASPATSFVLDTGQRIAGYVLALPYPVFRYPDLTKPEEAAYVSTNLHLHDLVIARDFRGIGRAKQLLHRVTANAASYERISLIAVAGSDTFWSAHGYRTHPEVALPGSYGTQAVYMSRTI